MSDNPQEVKPAQHETYDRIEARRRRREERWAARGSRYGGAWIGGAILIVIGVLFLLQNWVVISLENWWALFILIPAVGAFGAAWRSYEDAGGRLTASGRGSLIGGLILTMITAIFLFNLDWGILGPILIILVGFGLLLNAFLPSE